MDHDQAGRDHVPEHDLGYLQRDHQLGRDLRGLRDRAILLLGFAGGLRRSDIVQLDLGQGQTEDGKGYPEFLPAATGQPGGLILHIYGKGKPSPRRKMGHVTRVWPGK